MTGHIDNSTDPSLCGYGRPVSDSYSGYNMQMAAFYYESTRPKANSTGNGRGTKLNESGRLIDLEDEGLCGSFTEPYRVGCGKDTIGDDEQCGYGTWY